MEDKEQEKDEKQVFAKPEDFAFRTRLIQKKRKKRRADEEV